MQVAERGALVPLMRACALWTELRVVNVDRPPALPEHPSIKPDVEPASP